jgi:phage baseplate assembly protein W
MTIRYKGFNTIDQQKKFKLVDVDLVKRDLLNHFAIRKGEKLMNPNFGSMIWNMLYEPMTTDVQNAIVADVKRVVSYDPRLRVDNVIIDTFDQGIQLQIDLTFLPQNLSDRLVLQFDGVSNQLSTR